MRAAPAVVAALDAGVTERRLMAMAYALAGAVLGAWAAAHAGLVGNGAAAGIVLTSALALGLVGLVLGCRVLPGHAGRLVWDGQVWSLFEPRPASDPLPLTAVVVSLDLGRWLLLRLQPASGNLALWRVASADGVGPAWHGLRVALQAHAGVSPAGDPAA